MLQVQVVTDILIIHLFLFVLLLMLLKEVKSSRSFQHQTYTGGLFSVNISISICPNQINYKVGVGNFFPIKSHLHFLEHPLRAIY